MHSGSEAAALRAKCTFQDPEKLQNKLENKQPHGVIHIILYLRSQSPQEVGRPHPTMNNHIRDTSLTLCKVAFLALIFLKPFIRRWLQWFYWGQSHHQRRKSERLCVRTSNIGQASVRAEDTFQNSSGCAAEKDPVNLKHLQPDPIQFYTKETRDGHFDHLFHFIYHFKSTVLSFLHAGQLLALYFLIAWLWLMENCPSTGPENK